MDKKQTRCTHFFIWHVDERLHECLLREFAENGAHELSASSLLVEAIFSNPAKAVELRTKLEKADVSLPDIHGPWGGLWDLCAAETFMRRHLVNSHRLCLEILSDFGAKTYTVHIGRGDCMVNGGVFTPEMGRRVHEILEGILPTAERLGIVICIENSFNPAGTPAVLLSCLEPFKNSPAIGFCIDVGHAHIMDPDVPRPEGTPIVSRDYDPLVWGGHLREGMIPMGETFRLLGPNIVTAHVHDNNGLGDQHLFPGMGNCDFDFIFNELAKCPRLQSVQNEASFTSSGVSIAHACRAYAGMMARAFGTKDAN